MTKNALRAASGRMFVIPTIVAAAMQLIGSGAAKASDNDQCSVTSLSGVYAFHASGFNIVGAVAQPKAIVEVIQFNGDGTLTGGAATVSINGSIFHSQPTAPGAGGKYNVSADCI